MDKSEWALTCRIIFSGLIGIGAGLVATVATFAIYYGPERIEVLRYVGELIAKGAADDHHAP